MLVVSDTTAISNLLQINSLDLLQKIYGKVVVPKAVEKELLVLGKLGFPIRDVLAWPWVETKVLSDASLYRPLFEELDEGEAESIALAIELQASYLLIDEKKGRQAAKDNNLQIIGTLGVIIEAKRKGRISNIRSTMDELRKIGFWISTSLYQRVLEIEKSL